MILKNNNYSQELNNIFSYITDVLGKEFPTKVYGLEYLITSILDNPKSHAYVILNMCVMSHTINDLKEIYINWIKNNHNINIYDSVKNENKFDEDIERVLNYAEQQASLMKSDKISSEHVLLAMLHPISNCTKIIEVFQNIGIDYHFIISKMTNAKQNLNNKNKFAKSNCNFVTTKNNEIKKGNTSASESIAAFTVNINDLAKNGKFDKLIGREKELNQIIKTLARKQKNNVVIVGKGGVGKTQLVRGLAQAIVDNKVPKILENKEIVMLDAMAMVSGTKFRGMFEERIKSLFDDLKKSNRYILFIDDIQQVLKSQSKEKDTDISQWINDILVGGEVRVIATTNFKDYKNSIENNTSISRTLQKIVLEPNTITETIQIIRNIKDEYENYHHVIYDDNAIIKAVEWADRYVTDRSLPDSAIDLIDLSGAETCLDNIDSNFIQEQRNKLKDIQKEKQDALNNGEFERASQISDLEKSIKKLIADNERENDIQRNSNVRLITVEDIAKSVSEMTNIPISKLNTDEKEKIANMENTLKKVVIGQDDAVNAVCKAIKRNKVGLGNKNRIIASFLALGSTGTGKSFLAKQLAKELFGDENNIIRFDMSEYSEKNSVSKLIGAAPGYIGYENGGQLTEAVKNKQHCILLLDEIEKADKEIYNLFLQLFDEGRLTDSSGQVVNFKNVIVMMTSNVGAKEASESHGAVGFVTREDEVKKNITEKKLKQTFPPEFLNRIDQILYFNQLSTDNLKQIIKLEINKLKKRLQEQDLTLKYDEKAVNYIHSLAIKQKEYGARPIIRLIQDEIEDRITDWLLQTDVENGYIFNITSENNEILIN